MIRHSAFKPAWWLPGPHLQTLWPTLARRRPAVALRRERVELTDGDFLDLDWTHGKSGPLVVLLHGLEGSSRSRYAAGLLSAIQRRGWRGVVMHFRGCSGEPNRLARRYHAGDTGDLQTVVGILRQREPDTPLCVVGYSLGGNVLLNWLAESGCAAPVSGAVAVSVPFELGKCAERLEKGFSSIYQRAMLKYMHKALEHKHRTLPAPGDLDRILGTRNFRTFDDAYTAPVHGFRDVNDYYRRCSSRGRLGDIRVPTLILHAMDDPFMSPDAVPDERELSEHVTLELAHHGGHVGFVAGTWPWRPEYWLEQRIPEYLESKLVAQTAYARPQAHAPAGPYQSSNSVSSCE